MIDVKKIVKEASATGTCFAPPYHEQRIARHAVALTLRAVAKEIKLKWMLPERSISDFSMMLDAQAAAIEKGGG